MHVPEDGGWEGGGGAVRGAGQAAPRAVAESTLGLGKSAANMRADK